MIRIAICSLRNDLHALCVKRRLEQAASVTCHLVEVNRLAGSAGLNWTNEPGSGRVRAADGTDVRLAELELVWWRRGNYRQLGRPAGSPSTTLVNRECAAALHGAFATDFRGRWVDPPEHIYEAENKLRQLRAAARAGLVVPETLVSQDPVAIRAFVRRRGGHCIVKALRGLVDRQLLSRRLESRDLTDDAILSECPSLYQELVSGDRHLRLLAMEETPSVCAEFRTRRLDWRDDLRMRCTPWRVPAALERRVQALLAELRLSMGVLDLKLDRAGNPVFLEINPQGQFLFAEALAHQNFVDPFVRFLLRKCQRHSRPATPSRRVRGQPPASVSPSRSRRLPPGSRKSPAEGQ